MNSFLLVVFIASELLYYLLIAQTGIVEYFHSDILSFFTLPLGGVIGSVAVIYTEYSLKKKILFFLTFQFIASLFYPDLSLVMLFILGLSVGAMAPLFIYSLKVTNLKEIVIALSLSYAIGTSLFTTDVTAREPLALIFTLLAMAASSFIKLAEKKSESHSEFSFLGVVLMSCWVFLDSTLFETLSRSAHLDIWRSELYINIIIFHIVGLAAGFILIKNKITLNVLIWSSFILSYLFYSLGNAVVLSMVYPFVISLYNVAILKELVSYKSVKDVGFAMLFIGWIASGVGLMSALFGLSNFALIVPLIGAILIAFKKFILEKRISYV